MGTPFGIVAACELKNVEPGRSTLWASIKVEPRGKALEAERSPLAVALVIDVSGSMQGDPIAQVLKSCELVADLLSDRDQLSIVTFSTSAGVRCGLTVTDVTGKAQIKSSLAGIRADGGTNMHGGLEVAAGVLMSAPAGLRRTIVLLSDGQPNVGLQSANDLAGYVKNLKLAVSTLGFGLHHDENVLDAIATAGSGRYAYIPDPVVARVDLARAALAHGGIVADQLELRIAPADGVELVQLLPAGQLRHGKHGIATTIGDVFIDEARSLAVELRLDLKPGARGRLVELEVEGRAPDGTTHRMTATLDVDIRSGGPKLVDKDAQREIILVQADAARAQARAQADRGAHPAAAAILKQLAMRIDALEGFVRDDGSVIADLRETLQDEIEQYERKSTDVERMHQRKQSMAYKSATPMMMPAAAMAAPIEAMFVGIGGPVAGMQFPLLTEMTIGRIGGNAIPIASGKLSKRHARLMWANGGFVLVDLGSTNGTQVNGKAIHSHALVDGDLVEIGDAVFRFQVGARRP
ncbi:hypothetical protein BH11MYX3_BH11MYX3_16280 [soil metagenome]